jgi:hypothetical protein
MASDEIREVVIGVQLLASECLLLRVEKPPRRQRGSRNAGVGDESTAWSQSPTRRPHSLHGELN